MKKYKGAFWSSVGLILLLLLMHNNFIYEKEIDQLFISEVCSNNFSTGLKENYEDSDWIELHNPNDKAIFLGDYYLSDDKDDINKCKLPDVFIKADEYFALYALEDEKDVDADLNFKVNAGGGGALFIHAE